MLSDKDLTVEVQWYPSCFRKYFEAVIMSCEDSFLESAKLSSKIFDSILVKS